jgi:hypothetical protein
MKASKQGILGVRIISLASAALAVLAVAVVAGSNAPLYAQTGGWQLVPPEALPESGTFASMQFSNLPPVPSHAPPGFDIYWWSGTPGWYWVDDRAVDYAALREERQMDRYLRRLEAQYGLNSPEDSPPIPGDWLGDEGDYSPWPTNSPTVYAEGSLWLSIAELTNGAAPITVHGTVEGITYELLSKVTLTDAAWLSEGSVLGAASQYWTPAEVSVGNRTNTLFLWVRTPAAEGALGIWWQLQYFNETGIDPNADPDGDGWTNLQEYQNDTDPTVSDQPFKVLITRPAGNSLMP